MEVVINSVIAAALAAMHPEGVAQSLAENGRVIVSPQMFDHAERVARAVIEALREPTPEMIVAGEKEFFEHLPDARDWTLLYTKEAYRAMIDEALK